jgi:hypothetical protein
MCLPDTDHKRSSYFDFDFRGIIGALARPQHRAVPRFRGKLLLPFPFPPNLNYPFQQQRSLLAAGSQFLAKLIDTDGRHGTIGK